MIIRKNEINISVTTIGAEYYLVELNGQPAHVPVELTKIIPGLMHALQIVVTPFIVDEATAGKPTETPRNTA